MNINPVANTAVQNVKQVNNEVATKPANPPKPAEANDTVSLSTKENKSKAELAKEKLNEGFAKAQEAFVKHANAGIDGYAEYAESLDTTSAYGDHTKAKAAAAKETAAAVGEVVSEVTKAIGEALKILLG